MGTMAPDQPVETLHQRILEHYEHRPVSYRELEQRYGDEFDSFQETFASTVSHQEYRTGPDQEVDVFSGVNDNTIDALDAFQDYLNDTESWYLRRCFRNEQSKIETYQENVPELTQGTLDELYEENLLSKLGGISMVTDEGWWALYHNNSDGIYVPRNW